MTPNEWADHERWAMHYRRIQWLYPTRAYAIIHGKDPRTNSDLKKWRNLGRGSMDRC